MRAIWSVPLVCAVLGSLGCDSQMAGSDGGSDAGTGLAVLGSGTHVSSAVSVVEIVGAADRLSSPSDLAFHPTADHQLWITNQGDDSVVIVSAAGAPEQTSRWVHSAGSEHFLASPTALAMGETGTFATAEGTDAITQPSTPGDFMGPTLWPTDAALFDGGHASHLDMLHNSPNGGGIAWDHDNAFWLFDGYHSSITFYDFRMDHGPGGSDHTGGIITRYVAGEVGYVSGVNSHVELDRSTGLLYIADTGNARIAVLDTRSGTPGGRIGPDYDGAIMTAMNDAVLTTLVDGPANGVELPSGIALHDGILYVTDPAWSTIHAFGLDGTHLDYLDLRDVAGSLGGIEVDAEGRLYVTVPSPGSVLRIAPL